MNSQSESVSKYIIKLFVFKIHCLKVLKKQRMKIRLIFGKNSLRSYLFKNSNFTYRIYFQRNSLCIKILFMPALKFLINFFEVLTCFQLFGNSSLFPI